MDSKRRKIDSNDIEICPFLYLPVEMIKEILFYLSKKDRKILRTVCKTIESIVNTTFCIYPPIIDKESSESFIKGLNKFPFIIFNFILKRYTKRMSEIFPTIKTKKISLRLLKNSNNIIKMGKDVEKFILGSNNDSKKFQRIEVGESLKHLRIHDYQVPFDIISTKNQVERLDLYFYEEPATPFLKSFCDIFPQLKTIKLIGVFIEMKYFIFPCLRNLDLRYCCWEFKDFDFQLFSNVKEFSIYNCYSLNSDSSVKIWDFSKFFQLKNLKFFDIDLDEILLPPNVQHLTLFPKNEKILYTSKLSPLIESLLYYKSSKKILNFKKILKKIMKKDTTKQLVEFDQFPPNLRKINAFIPFNILEEIEAHYRVNWKRKLTLRLGKCHNFSNEQKLFCKNNFIME